MMIRNILVFWLLQLDGKMRPGDRLPDEDFGPPPPLSEYFRHLGFGVVFLLIAMLLAELASRLKTKNGIASNIILLLACASFICAVYHIFPLLLVWYTWVFVAGIMILLFLIMVIYENVSLPNNKNKRPRIREKEWESLAKLTVYISYTEKPDANNTPRAHREKSTLDRKNKKRDLLYVNKYSPVEYNPYYGDPTVGQWQYLDFRYIDKLDNGMTAYCYFDIMEDPETYFSLPEDVLNILTNLVKQREEKQKSEG